MTREIERTPLNAMLEGLESTQNGVGVSVPSDWMQGRAIYGGLSASMALTAARRAFPDLPPLRSAQLTFIGPSGADVELVSSLLRQGKSATFINVDMIGGGQTSVRANLCFGARRDSRFSGHWLAGPDVSAPEDCEDFFQEGFGPDFACQFNSRRAAGQPPVSGADIGDLCAWLQHKDDLSRTTAEGLVALADALPPAALSMFTTLAPVSTMTWLFDVVGNPSDTRDGWWLCRSTTQAAFDGYSAQNMAVWNTDGRPVIIGRQNVAVFA